MLTHSGPVGGLQLLKHGRPGLNEAMPESGTADGAGRAVEEACETRGSAHLERELEESGVDNLGRPATSAGADSLNDGQVGAVGWVNRGMRRRVEVLNHSLDTVLQQPILIQWEDAASLTSRH